MTAIFSTQKKNEANLAKPQKNDIFVNFKPKKNDTSIPMRIFTCASPPPEDQSFTVYIGKEYSNNGNLSCGAPQVSILGPLIFLLYANDMARAVDHDLLLYADDSCLILRDKGIEQIEINLNRNFNTLCDWFSENKLSIHFWEDITKSILFGRKIARILKKLDIRRGDILMK